MRIGMQTVYRLALSTTIFTMLFVGGVLHPRAATAVTYYVATIGSDSNPGTQLQPFRTITKGMKALVAGDVLYIRSGTYPEGIQGRGKTSLTGTSWANAPRIAAYPGERVTIPHMTIGAPSIQYVIFDGLIVDPQRSANEAVSINTGAHHIRIQNCEIKNALHHGINVAKTSGGFNHFINLNIHDNGTVARYDHGIYISASNNILEGSKIHRNAAYGIHIYDGGAVTANNNIVRNNEIYANGILPGTSYGLIIANGNGNVAYNNLIYGNAAGANISLGASNSRLYNNTIYSNARGGGIVINPGTTMAYVRNNIVYKNLMEIINNGSNTIISHNLTTDPKFVNASTNRFHLQHTSPAIDTAIALTEVPTDFIGSPRPRGSGCDIGAYEFQSIPAPTNIRAQ